MTIISQPLVIQDYIHATPQLNTYTVTTDPNPWSLTDKYYFSKQEH